MLTTKDRIWLKNREKKDEYCKWCPQHGKLSCPREGIPIPITECPTYKLSCDWIDAAEFEARVARYISDNILLDCYCLCGEDEDPESCEPYRKHGLTCSWCRIRYARLMVEEKMDDCK